MLGALGGLRGWLGCGLFGLGWAVAGLAWRAGLGWGWLAGALGSRMHPALHLASICWGLGAVVAAELDGSRSSICAGCSHTIPVDLILEDFGLIRLWDLGFTLMGSLIVIPE